MKLVRVSCLVWFLLIPLNWGGLLIYLWLTIFKRACGLSTMCYQLVSLYTQHLICSWRYQDGCLLLPKWQGMTGNYFIQNLMENFLIFFSGSLIIWMFQHFKDKPSTGSDCWCRKYLKWNKWWWPATSKQTTSKSKRAEKAKPERLISFLFHDLLQIYFLNYTKCFFMLLIMVVGFWWFESTHQCIHAH